MTFTGSGAPGGDDATAGQMSRLQEVLAASRDADGNIREGWGDIYKFADEQVRNIYAQGIGYRGKDGDAKAYDRPPSGDGNNRALGYFIGSTDGGAAPGGVAQRPMPFMSGGQGVGVGRTADGREVTTYDLPQRGTGTIREQDGTIHTLTPDGAITTTRPQPQQAAPASAPAAESAVGGAGAGQDGEASGGGKEQTVKARLESSRSSQAELKDLEKQANAMSTGAAMARKNGDVKGAEEMERKIASLREQMSAAGESIDGNLLDDEKKLSRELRSAQRQYRLMSLPSNKNHNPDKFKLAEERLVKAQAAYDSFMGEDEEDDRR